MTPAPEFSRPVPISPLGGTQAIEASLQERDALARRFGLLALDHLSATLDITRNGEALMVSGAISARLEQSCVITGEAVAQEIEDHLALRFLPESMAPEAEEMELEEDDCETLYHDGEVINLGEAVAQTMALALDPFPKSASAEAEARAAGIIPDDEVAPASPFAALQSLKDSGKTQGA